ncbi:glycerate kinase isoform 1-T3 [Anomaloglossus baeobatrachus]|uniref:glycerate kinase n=1 Tax=Anomaloglossus baeobatrachus TaxID=238106 RepID=UPI003F50AFD8
MAQLLGRVFSRLSHRPIRNMATLQDDAHQVFWSAVSAVLPPRMLRRALAVRETSGPPVLECGGKEILLENNLYLVGFGKAVLGMAAAVEQIVGKHLVEGVISVPQGIQETLRKAGKRDMLLSPGSRIRVMEGAADNMPDEAAMTAAGEIQKVAEKLQEKHVLLVLISGGGSALLPAPVPPLTLQDKQAITKQLALKGATIQELNTIRRGLSQLKGGGLSRAAHPAQVVSLILSDVIGDDLDVIASGPTVCSSYRAEDCLQILSKYGLRGSVPAAVEDVLLSRPRPDPAQDHGRVHNILIGSNLLSLREAEQEAQRLGYVTSLLSTAISGDVHQVSRFYALLGEVLCSYVTGTPQSRELEESLLAVASSMDIPGLHLAARLQEVKEAGASDGVCLLCGGETTVQVQGKGRGGRNQELALRVAAQWHQSAAAMQGCEVVLLSGGTDGQDGPTPAAGAISSPQLVAQAGHCGLDIENFLNASDSYGFYSQFQNGRHLLVTGLTGTNVMDVQVLLVRRRKNQ